MSTSLGEGWRRTHRCGELRAEHEGQTVVLNGWVEARRDLGGIYFLELRDRAGQVQVVLPPEIDAALKLGPEYVLAVRGRVDRRFSKNVNPNKPTGEIEVAAEAVEILSEAKTPPFEIRDELDTAVETRLRYRFMDLRRPCMQQNLLHRSRFINALRRAFEDQEFAEIETPILTKATPEGARDYLVPSRVHPGEFYALPQSPQIFKQVLMVSGMDRYFQVARCFRDEDLRADRQPEFTQLDMEMSFVEEEDVFEAWEKALVEAFRASSGREIQTPFPRMRWSEAMDRFGSDKPDTRFGLEFVDCQAWAETSEFVVFKGTVDKGGAVLGIVAPGGASLSRKQIDALEAHAKDHGAKGLAWWKAGADGGSGPLSRFCADGRGAELMQLMGASDGDLCVFVADARPRAQKALGAVRLALADTLGVEREGWNFLWVTHFPMFERDEEAGRWVSLHHPFTAPADWELAGDPGEMESRAYDLVLNGWELGSGSIRIHRSDVQQRVFELLGIGPEEQREKFGFLLDALSYGAPPHGGFAVGLDRLVALSLGLGNIRDTIAFPKTASAADLMCGAPSSVPTEQLNEIHVGLAGKALAEPSSSS